MTDDYLVVEVVCEEVSGHPLLTFVISPESVACGYSCQFVERGPLLGALGVEHD